MDNFLSNQEISDPYLHILNDFVLEKLFAVDESKTTESNANDIAINSLYAIQKNSKSKFIKFQTIIQRRKPKNDSDWIYNELLMFAIVLGIKKFGLEDTWCKSVLSCRLSKPETNLITQTYLDVLVDNFENKNNYQPLIIIYKYFIEKYQFSEYGLQSSINDLFSSAVFSPSQPFFLIINKAALRIILLKKGLINQDLEEKKEIFSKTFTKKVHCLSVFYWSIMLIFFIVITPLIAYFVYFFPNRFFQDHKVLITGIFSFSSLISILLFPIKKRKSIINFFTNIRYREYKFPKENDQ